MHGIFFFYSPSLGDGVERGGQAARGGDPRAMNSLNVAHETVVTDSLGGHVVIKTILFDFGHHQNMHSKMHVRAPPLRS